MGEGGRGSSYRLPPAFHRLRTSVRGHSGDAHSSSVLESSHLACISRWATAAGEVTRQAVTHSSDRISTIGFRHPVRNRARYNPLAA